MKRRLKERIIKEKGSEEPVVCEGKKRKRSIGADISRLYAEETFEGINSGGMHEDILQVLMAFCNYNPKTSYVQFMAHLTQVLLLYMPPRRAFIALSNLLQKETFSIFIHFNSTLIQKRIDMFTRILVFNEPRIASHLENKRIPPDLFVMDWCMTLFSSQLSLKVLSRIWDLYFLFGEIIIWKCAVSILIVLEELYEFVGSTLQQTIFLLRSLPSRLCSEDYLVKKLYSVRLPRDVSLWFRKNDPRRKARRKRRKRNATAKKIVQNLRVLGAGGMMSE